MFEDDVDYSGALDYVFTNGMPHIGSELRSMGATVSRGSCPSCGGVVYDHDHEVVCANCSMVIGSNDDKRPKQSEWEYFRNNRSSYNNSGRTRCVGGFASVYSWVERDEIDRPVKKIDPTTFYE